MLGLNPEIKFRRTEVGWESSYEYDDVVEPLADSTFELVMSVLEDFDFIPEHCILVDEHEYEEWEHGDTAFTITIKFDNEADEAEFIMRVINEP